MRGKSRAARSPASRASRLDGTGIDSTRTEGPKEAATSAVSSVQPLATTITSKSCGCAGDTSCPSRRPITRASLCAGTTTLTTGGKYARTPALTWCQVTGAGGALRHALSSDALTRHYIVFSQEVAQSAHQPKTQPGRNRQQNAQSRQDLLRQPHRTPGAPSPARRAPGLRATTARRHPRQAQLPVFRPAPNRPGLGIHPARPQFRGVCPRRSAQPTGRTHHRPAANQLTKTFGCFGLSFTPDFPKFHESNQQLRHLPPPPSLSAGLYWNRGVGPLHLSVRKWDWVRSTNPRATIPVDAN